LDFKCNTRLNFVLCASPIVSRPRSYFFLCVPGTGAGRTCARTGGNSIEACAGSGRRVVSADRGGTGSDCPDCDNAALNSLNAKVAAVASDCRHDFREQQPGKPGRDVWQREVDITMRGPRFLSLLATDSYYCGGMSPNDGLLLPLVYDLKSGRPVDWLTLLPTGAKAVLDTAADGSRVGVVVWPWLRRRAIHNADGECKSAFTDFAEVTFGLWLDAKKGALMAQPSGFPHAEAACAETISISVDEAARIGVAKELVESLKSAHARMAINK
jgi:hypothetical protein